MDQVSKHETFRHKIEGQDISFENRLHYNAACNSFFKQQQNTSHNSQQQTKLYNMLMYNMLKSIKCYENINLKLTTGEQ